MRGVIKSLGLLFVQALAVGLAEQQRWAAVRAQRRALRIPRSSGMYRGHNGEREMARRRRQYAAGQLRFHSYER